MAAAAAAAAQASALAVQASVANQAAILAALTAQQTLLQRQFEERFESDSSSKEPKDLERGAAYYNPWSLGTLSYLAKRKRDWACQMTDASLLAHPNYPADAPPNPGNPAAQAAAQAEVDAKRRKTQTDLHDLLTRKCGISYYAECSSIQLNFTNCGTLLWRAIYISNNPDGEAQTNSLRTAMTAQCASFSGEWEQWMADIQTIQVQLTHLNEPFTDREFREHIFKATRKVSGWETWTELKKDIRPPLTFFDIKLSGQSKWAELNEGNVTALLQRVKLETKTETANMVFGKGPHNPKNCKDAHCSLDHGDLKYCSYHQKWTGHARDACNMLREDIALQKQSKQLKG